MTTELWRVSELQALEVRPIWRKRVTIFGRSVPLTLLLLALLTVTALAGAWAITKNHIIFADPAPQVSGNFDMPPACLITAGPGTVDICDDGGDSQPEMRISGATDATEASITATWNNTGVTDVVFTLGAAPGPEFTASSAQDGATILGAGNLPITVDYQFVGLLPGVPVANALVPLNFELAP